ncbi:type IV secretory system conjugative DNA transfer family protein [Alcanivorax sp. 1008]|uniref:type IV secretory system conjugative DNA transfer family protein n=1 Tax=Alcanivorax sp. 1008 TaxID=2816853 RepID=UPI001E14DCC6|nr:type IV secretory system conjugative DNA transfer family protein [Alcanivorax sp. 1008]MCC1496714.1 type IV secretory system conjugative DNA transfer family protein [Alcanivorax sp. 1008]
MIRATLIAVMATLLPHIAAAENQPGTPAYSGIFPVPTELKDHDRYLNSLLKVVPAGEQDEEGEEDSLRLQALRVSAMEYGSDAGFYWQAHQFDRYLRHHEKSLDEIFDFTALMVKDDGGRLLQPAVISESVRVAKISDNGQAIRTVAHHYRVLQPARFALQPPTWRDYLPVYAQPPQSRLMVKPKPKEVSLWREFVLEGFRAGVTQADLTIRSNMAMLARDRAGMVRYHILLQQGLVAPPEIDSRYQGVTGGGREMAVEDRVLTIRAPAALNSNSGDWEPIPKLPRFEYLNISIPGEDADNG